MSMEPETSLPSQSRRQRSLRSYFAIGCGVVVLLVIAYPIYLVFWFTWTFRGEGLPHSLSWMETTEGTNCSYFYNNYLGNTREYDISEADFLKISEASGQRLVHLKDASDEELFVRTVYLNEESSKAEKWSSRFETVTVNGKTFTVDRKPDREIRVQRLHKRFNSKHEHCQWYDCKIDPTGKTDDSCFHVITNGWFDGVRFQTHGGIKYVYDLDNGRFYREFAPR